MSYLKREREKKRKEGRKKRKRKLFHNPPFYAVEHLLPQMMPN
jgi:hypothetical protein